MALFIGGFLPDRKLDESIFCKALTTVAIDLAQFRQHPLQLSKPNLDICFLMPGKDEMPEFEGMYFRSFDAATNTLQIESSVPPKMIQSAHAKNYIVAAMLDAVDGAHDFFDTQKIEFRRDEYQYLIETLAAENGAYLH